MSLRGHRYLKTARSAESDDCSRPHCRNQCCLGVPQAVQHVPVELCHQTRADLIGAGPRTDEMNA
jgi:hypothetical protein